jgi:hypothetical protein
MRLGMNRTDRGLLDTGRILSAFFRSSTLCSGVGVWLARDIIGLVGRRAEA